MGSPEQNACGISNLTYEVFKLLEEQKKCHYFEIDFEMP
jgi:hypothetical protein